MNLKITAKGRVFAKVFSDTPEGRARWVLAKAHVADLPLKEAVRQLIAIAEEVAAVADLVAGSANHGPTPRDVTPSADGSDQASFTE